MPKYRNDWIDLYDDPAPEDAQQLLDTCIEQIEYHRNELLRWRELKRRAELAIPRSPVEELLDVARAAWEQD
jgi:hypothetical protein